MRMKAAKESVKVSESKSCTNQWNRSVIEISAFPTEE